MHACVRVCVCVLACVSTRACVCACVCETQARELEARGPFQPSDRELAIDGARAHALVRGMKNSGIAHCDPPCRNASSLSGALK